MTQTHLKWIASAIVALVVLWWGGRLLRSGMDDAGGEFRLSAVSADSTDSVVVASAAETIVLARGPEGTWTVNGLAGGAAAVQELFAALAGSAPAELVARSSASFARLGLDSAAARRLRVVRGDRTLVDVLLSERGPDFRSVYVRMPGDSAIYALSGGLAEVARRQLDDWREKTIATLTPDSVREIELERRGRRAVLRKADGGWRFGTAPADSGAVQRLLERYRAVSAAGFPTSSQRDSIFRGRLWRRALLRGSGGTPLLTLEFDSTVAGVWVRRPGAVRDSIYRINTWDADELVPADSTLRGRP